MPCLSEEEFYTLSELETDWHVTPSRIKCWLIASMLRAHLWLPVMSVFAVQESSRKNVVKKLRHYEGFVPLTAPQCLRLYRSGMVTLRMFPSRCGNELLHIPEAADDIRAGLDDLFVLAEERRRFERVHGLQRSQETNDTDPPIQPTLTSDDFRSITIGGEVHYFGDLQAAILKRLHDAAQDGEPWQSGKQLLREIGSESFTLSNIFKHKPVWKQLIESDGRGYYRLHPDLTAQTTYP